MFSTLSLEYPPLQAGQASSEGLNESIVLTVLLPPYCTAMVSPCSRYIASSWRMASEWAGREGVLVMPRA